MSNDSSASKSISSMFSSISTTSCSGGVSPASTGRASTGMLAFLPSRGRPWLRPQNEVGKRGLIRQIRAMGRPAWVVWEVCGLATRIHEKEQERPRIEIATRYGTGQ